MNELMRIMGYTAPLTASLFCLGLLTVRRFATSGTYCRIKQDLLDVMAIFYAVMAVNWVQPLLYIYCPEVYAHESVIYFVELMLTQVLFYHIVYKITSVEEQNSFPRIHYAVIGVFGMAFAGWSLLIPYDVRLALAATGEMQAGYGAYSMLSIHKLELRGIYTIIYGILCIRRLLRYRKTILEYSADQARSSLEWLYSLIILTLVFAPLPMTAFFIPNRALATSLVPMFWGTAYIVLFMVLCYNMLAGNYVMILPEKQEHKKDRWHRHLAKTDFEAHMHRDKPYLKPKLKITDLTAHLGINRAYLSGFINKEYGMNFSRYINQQRMKELERLHANPEYDKLSEVELVLKAGFSSYYGYRSFMRAEEKLKKRPFVR
ncbi:MAG: AraC family transcriptional regulator [Mediterranea sp.]|jgi:AraC-like DNA-binding protein|nr:AraC family transcriptional regulator [Mediterranea sp.]